MGCTSSAPNTTPPPANATVETDELPAADKESPAQKSDEIQVLPSCDSVNDHEKLVSNHNFMEEEIVMTDNDTPVDANQIVETMLPNQEEANENEDKLSKLEEVVERVVELYITDQKNETADLHNHETNDLKSDYTIEENNHPDSNIEQEMNGNRVNELEEQIRDTKSRESVDIGIEEEMAHLEEAVSPSQSTSSRVTRWEALADIAAELPPSLTVDPLTGQIYALSK